MADQKQQFTKVNQLRPGDTKHNLTVKVVNAKIVEHRGRNQGGGGGQFAECLVGDETGMIIFSARNEFVDMAKEGSTLVFTEARIEVFKGSMRLVVDRRNNVKVVEPASFSVYKDNNMSLLEFECVNVVG